MTTTVKEKIFKALEKDSIKRYIGYSAIQSDGRLELDSTAISILNPKDEETFYAINDESSIIIVRNPLPQHKDRIIAQTAWDAKKKRLRLNQICCRILLTCKVGFRVFKYGDEIALEAEPYINPREINRELDDIVELAPYILRAPRSIYYLNIITTDQKFYNIDMNFKIMGEYWIRKFHQDPLDTSFKMSMCTGSGCIYCGQNLPIIRTVCWFPGLMYDRDYPRPGIISVRDEAFSICEPLFRECDLHKTSCKNDEDVKFYYKEGITSYEGKTIFHAYIKNKEHLKIEFAKQDNGFSIDERGLMKLSLKELEDIVKTNS